MLLADWGHRRGRYGAMAALHAVLESRSPFAVSRAALGALASDGVELSESIALWPWIPARPHVLAADAPASCRYSPVLAIEGAGHTPTTSEPVQRGEAILARCLTEGCGTRLRSSPLLRGDLPHPFWRMSPSLLVSG
jgi:hypothetical protein